jgi:hypothetical protein
LRVTPRAALLGYVEEKDNAAETITTWYPDAPASVHQALAELQKAPPST